MSALNLTAIYYKAAADHGKAIADAAVARTIERFDCDNLSGDELQDCKQAQAAAFAEAIEQALESDA
jgi:hypothetical protein